MAPSSGPISTGKISQHIVPPGGTFTPKQLQLDKKNGKLYWCDREGMRVMRCNLDGSKIETLIDTSQGDSRPGRTQRNGAWASLSMLTAAKFYWTQKGPDNAGEGRIFRANLEIPKGQTPANRKDHRTALRKSARTHRPRPRPCQPDDVLDRPRRPAARQHGESGAHGCGAREIAKIRRLFSNDLMEGIGLSLDCKGWPHVFHRLGRIRLQRESRWIEQEDVAFRPRESSRHRLRRNSRKFLKNASAGLAV